ncbi:MAG: hypothetical protein AABZ84_05480 [Pseudomonadota bacterium]
MQIAKLGQDYYGTVRSPVSPAPGEAGDRTRTAEGTPSGRPTASPPVERVVEGEWLKGSSGSPDDFFERIWRHRSSEAGSSRAGASASPYETQRAINAYLSQAAQFERRPAGGIATVDYYA